MSDTDDPHEEWFNAAAQAFYAVAPKDVHCVFVVADAGGTGVSSCCGIASDQTLRMLNDAMALARHERNPEMPAEPTWITEADANGAH